MERTARPAARERILDAAATVMREKGIARTTTKSIAAAAGYSEAMLYKHFADKQELFLVVLQERLPVVRVDHAGAGTGNMAENLTRVVEQLMEFFTQSFPIAASIFGSPDLLAQHREGVTGRGYGPRHPVLSVQAYLDAERDAGRIRTDGDTASAARALVGAAFHQAFLAAFEGEPADDAHETATGVVAVVLPSLIPGA